MKCQIGQAITKIDELLASRVSEHSKSELTKVKIKLNSAIDIKMARMQSNTTGYESKRPDVKKDFRSQFKQNRPSATKWVNKEVAKFDVATQAISDGTNNSTAGFVKDFYGDKANTGTYTKDDVIYLSTNGNRTGRVVPVKNGVLQGAYKNIDKAIEAGAKFVADTSKHLASTGKYNIGEVELAEYLQSKGYTREDKDGYGLWSQNKVDSQAYNPQSNIIYNPEFHKTKYPEGKDYVQMNKDKSYDMHIELALLNSPSILKIGTKEQYINYLKTIFPDSEHQELFSHRGSFSPKDSNLYNKLNSEKIDLLKDYLDSIGFKYKQNRDDLIRYSVENINILTDKDIGLSYKDKVYGVITAYLDEGAIAPELSETILFDSENVLYEISVTKELYGKLKELDYKYSFINKEGFDKKFIGTGDKRSAIGDNSFSGFSFTNYVNNDTGSQAYMMPGYAGLQKESDILVAKLNTKNIKLTDSGITNVDDKTDTLIIGHITNEIIVKDNNQIHILGSVEDIKKFKKFVKYNNNNPQLEPAVDNNNYKTISKDDIEAAKDIMSNNKKECE